MGSYKRINVSSSRPLEPLANYSRALRCGDMVLQSGTTAIDTNGDIIGENDIGAQVDAIVDIARDTMGQAGGSLEDVVRSRIYVTDVNMADDAMRAFGRHFRDIRPAVTLLEIARLARPTQLIEIEFDAVDGARDRAKRISSVRPLEEQYGYSRAVRMDDTVYVSGTTARDPDGNVVATGERLTGSNGLARKVPRGDRRTGLARVDRVGMLARSRHQRSGQPCISIPISRTSSLSTIRWYSIS